MGMISINVGGSSGRSSLAPWPPDDNMLNQIDHKIYLIKNGQDVLLESTKVGDILWVTVPAGTWTVRVDAYYEDVYYATGEKKDIVIISGKKEEVTVTMTRAFLVRSLAEYNAALAAIREYGSGEIGREKNYIINIQGDINDITPSIDFLADDLTFGETQHIIVTLKGRGTLNTRNENGAMFTLFSYQTLIIDGDLTLRGRRAGVSPHTSDNDRAVIQMSGAGAKLELKKGIITGNSETGGSAGGVRVNMGTLIMNGGEISDNTGAIGGVSVDQLGSVFRMKGGEIKDNTGTLCGGVVLYDNSVFIMTGGYIQNNQSTGANSDDLSAGGVLIIYRYWGFVHHPPADFLKTGGTIYGNEASPGNRNTSFNGYSHAVGFWVWLNPSFDNTTYVLDAIYYRDTTLGPNDDISTLYPLPEWVGQERNGWKRRE